MGTLLRTIIVNTSRMQLFLLLTTVTIFIGEIKSDCKATRNNTPWRIIKIDQLGENKNSTDCNLKCVAVEDKRCGFWTMNQLTKECLLIGYPEKFNLQSNQIIYVS